MQRKRLYALAKRQVGSCEPSALAVKPLGKTPVFATSHALTVQT